MVTSRKHQMPAVTFTDAELEALYAVCTNAERIDWSAYDRARQRIVDAERQHLESRGSSIATDFRLQRKHEA
jgi:hypothetical protein